MEAVVWIESDEGWLLFALSVVTDIRSPSSVLLLNLTSAECFALPFCDLFLFICKENFLV